MRFENSTGFAFHLSNVYYMYPTCKISKKMHACCEAAGGEKLM